MKKFPHTEFPRELFKLGEIHIELNEFDAALRCFRRAALFDPDNPEIYHNNGSILAELFRHDDALRNYNRALRLRPNFAEALSNRAILFRNINGKHEASYDQQKAIIIRPNNCQFYFNRGNQLYLNKSLEDALLNYRRAIVIKVDFLEAHVQLGVGLYSLKPVYEALDPPNHQPHVKPGKNTVSANDSGSLKTQTIYDEAIQSYRRAICLRPTEFIVYANLSLAYEELSKFHKALLNAKRAFLIDNNGAQNNFNISILQLRLGLFADGWKNYEWRWETLGLAKAKLYPFMDHGTLLSGKTVLIRPEQGSGDFIQMVRYAPLIEKKGANVIIEADPLLLPLLETLNGNYLFIRTGSCLPYFDFGYPIMSLPYAFETSLGTIPVNIPYLYSTPEKYQKWSHELGVQTNYRIGIAWAPNDKGNFSWKRYIPLEKFQPLFELPFFEFHSLQYTIKDEDHATISSLNRVYEHTANLVDFSDTAALIDSMDIIISADVNIVHVAGAMGKDVLVLLPYSADWRWMINRRDSPWYPTATLFRQSKPNDWENVMEHIKRFLVTLLKSF